MIRALLLVSVALCQTACRPAHVAANWYLAADLDSPGETKPPDQCAQPIYLGLLNLDARRLDARQLEIVGWPGAVAVEPLEPGEFRLVKLGSFSACRLPTALTILTADGKPIRAAVREPMPSALAGGARPCCLIGRRDSR